MRPIILLLLLLVCLASACGCTTQPASQPAEPLTTKAVDGPVRIVSLKESSYNPEMLYITKGTTVTWVNEESRMSRRVVHMPTEATGRILFESKSLSPGESYSYTFTVPGRYVYADPQHGGGRSPFVEVT
ncbi:MAG: hypothetical protein GYA23_07685 [Methanomicrobiales archaeon]|nr:hypothetical protein [Methanomicrobiales archaeon]